MRCMKPYACMGLPYAYEASKIPIRTCSTLHMYEPSHRQMGQNMHMVRNLYTDQRIHTCTLICSIYPTNLKKFNTASTSSYDNFKSVEDRLEKYGNISNMFHSFTEICYEQCPRLYKKMCYFCLTITNIKMCNFS